MLSDLAACVSPLPDRLLIIVLRNYVLIAASSPIVKGLVNRTSSGKKQREK